MLSLVTEHVALQERGQRLLAPFSVVGRRLQVRILHLIERFSEVGEGVPESDEIAARWYRKAADHFSDVSGVWEAEVQMNYMYRDGRLRKDYVEAYMWAAIVGSSGNPPDDSDMMRCARHMTKTQIAEAQRRAEDWIKRHKPLPQNVVATPRWGQ